MNDQLVSSEQMLIRAATAITAEHLRLQRDAEVKAHNAAIDRASEIVSEWIAHGRDESTLFDALSDAKIWTR